MSDHSGLRYLFDQPNLNGRQARWLATISEFDFEIRYIINFLTLITRNVHCKQLTPFRVTTIFLHSYHHPN